MVSLGDVAQEVVFTPKYSLTFQIFNRFVGSIPSTKNILYLSKFYRNSGPLMANLGTICATEPSP